MFSKFPKFWLQYHHVAAKCPFLIFVLFHIICFFFPQSFNVFVSFSKTIKRNTSRLNRRLNPRLKICFFLFFPILQPSFLFLWILFLYVFVFFWVFCEASVFQLFLFSFSFWFFLIVFYFQFFFDYVFCVSFFPWFLEFYEEICFTRLK